MKFELLIRNGYRADKRLVCSSHNVIPRLYEMDSIMKKIASSLLLALALATPVVMPAVQAKTTAPQSKVAQATETKPKKAKKAKKSAMKKDAAMKKSDTSMKKEEGAMKKTETPASATPAEPAKK